MTSGEQKQAAEIKEREEWLETIKSPPLPSLPIVNDQDDTSCTPCTDRVEDQDQQSLELSRVLSDEMDMTASPDIPDKNSSDSSLPSHEPDATTSQSPSSEPPESPPTSSAVDPSLTEQAQVEEELDRWLASLELAAEAAE